MLPMSDQEKAARAQALVKRLEDLAREVAEASQAQVESTAALGEQIAALEQIMEQVIQVLLRFQSYIDYLAQTYPPQQAQQARGDILTFVANLATLAKKLQEGG